MYIAHRFTFVLRPLCNRFTILYRTALTVFDKWSSTMCSGSEEASYVLQKLNTSLTSFLCGYAWKSSSACAHQSTVILFTYCTPTKKAALLMSCSRRNSQPRSRVYTIERYISDIGQWYATQIWEEWQQQQQQQQEPIWVTTWHTL